MNWSIRRWSLGGTQSSALKRPDSLSPRGTCAAMRAGRSETSKDWIAPTPDSPLSSFFPTRSTPSPRGLTSPIPVTTTRLIPVHPITAKPLARSAVGLDETHSILDGNDLFRGVVGNLAAEFLLERHHQLDGVETVGPQIVDETGVFGHLGFLDAEMLDDDLLHSVGDVTHPYCPSMADWQMLFFDSARCVSDRGSAVICRAIAAALKVAGHITRIRQACQSGELRRRSSLYHHH